MVRLRLATLLALSVGGAAYAQAPQPQAPQQQQPSRPSPQPPQPSPQPQAPQPQPPQQQPQPPQQQPPQQQPQPQAQPDTPQDPYGGDPVLNEQIAEQLVGRAQDLLDAKMWLDAKQLAVEALVKSPKGASAERARYIIKVVNQHLDIKEDPAPTPPSEVPPTDPYATPKPAHDPTQPDLTPIDGPSLPPARDTRDEPGHGISQGEKDTVKDIAMVHGLVFGGTLGATLGSAANSHGAGTAVGVGIGVGLGAGLLARPIASSLHYDVAQMRTVGSFGTWVGVAGGFFGEAVTGAGSSSPSATGILLGATIGQAVGFAAGAGFAHQHKLTRGDVALVDTLSGIGAFGGLTMGMLMQPAQPEAYSVNSIIGVSAGILVGVVAAPQTNTTPRRMARVAGLAAAGGAIPFVLYAGIHDPSTSSDERVTGLLSSIGMVGGAILGFRLTANMDVGLDVDPNKPVHADADDAPIALVGRSSDGNWGVGGIGVMPLSKQLATNNRGMTFTLVGATF